MAKWNVEITRSISVTVTVEAEDEGEAVTAVDRHDFELPPRDEWAGHKDWRYTVTPVGE